MKKTSALAFLIAFMLPLLLSLIGGVTARAQEEDPETTVPAGASSPHTSMTNNVSKRKSKVRKKYFDFSVGAIAWQESIRATRDANSSLLRAQFTGFVGGASYNSFFSKRWRQHYALDLAYGGLKAKGRTAEIPDELKGQNWLMTTLTPALYARTTPYSEVGIGLPLSYRLIQWKLKSGTALKLEKESSSSAGISGIYVNRFTARSSIHVSVTHQHMWDTVLWAAGWAYVF